MKIYEGMRVSGEAIVTVDAESLNPRNDLRNHSPTGYEWGYGGSGPAQLALAILADSVGERLALEHYQEFKHLVVAGLPHKSWVLTGEQVLEAVAKIKAKAERT